MNEMQRSRDRRSLAGISAAIAACVLAGALADLNATALAATLLLLGAAALRFGVAGPGRFIPAMILLVFTIVALWAGSDLAGMRGIELGPGTAPRLFLVSMGVLCAFLAAQGIFATEPASTHPPVYPGILLCLGAIVYTVMQSPEGRLAGIALGAAGAACGLFLLYRRQWARLRGPFLITLSLLLFALLVRPLGLVIASFASIMIASAASPEMRPHESVLWAGLLTLGSVLLFITGLNLPLQAWPR